MKGVSVDPKSQCNTLVRRKGTLRHRRRSWEMGAEIKVMQLQSKVFWITGHKSYEGQEVDFLGFFFFSTQAS